MSFALLMFLIILIGSAQEELPPIDLPLPEEPPIIEDILPIYPVVFPAQMPTAAQDINAALEQDVWLASILAWLGNDSLNLTNQTIDAVLRKDSNQTA